MDRGYDGKAESNVAWNALLERPSRMLRGMHCWIGLFVRE